MSLRLKELDRMLTEHDKWIEEQEREVAQIEDRLDKVMRPGQYAVIASKFDTAKLRLQLLRVFRADLQTKYDQEHELVHTGGEGA